MTIVNIRPGARLKVASRGVTQDDLAATTQPLDPTLSALAFLDATPGLVEQTGADAFTKRALGVSAANSVLTRNDGDLRYADIATETLATAVNAEVVAARSGQATLDIRIDQIAATAGGAAPAADVTALTAEIVAAREGSASLDAKLDLMEAATTTVTTEVVNAREGAASLDAKLDLMEAATATVTTDVATLTAEIVAAREGSASLDAKLDIMESAALATTNEVIAAREGEVSLDAKLDLIEAALVALTTEVTNARSGSATLDARIDSIASGAGILPNAITTVHIRDGTVLGEDMAGAISGGMSWPMTPFLEYRPAENEAGAMLRHGSSVPVNTTDILRLIKGASTYLAASSVTATYASQTGPEGQTTAHRIVSTGGAQAGIFSAPSFIGTAGQPYTFTFDIRTTPGAAATQTLRGGPSTAMANITATTAWQTVEVTLTPSSPTTYSFWVTRNNASEGAFDVIVDNIRVVKGTTVSAVPAVDGHVMFGPSQMDAANPTFAGGFINGIGSTAGIIELAASKTFTELTFMFASRHTVTPTGLCPVLSAGNYTDFHAGLGTVGAAFRAAGDSNTRNAPYTYSEDKGWMTIGYRIKNGVQQILVNGAIYIDNLVAPFPGFTTKFMEMFGYGGIATITGHPGDLGPLVLFDEYLNDEDIIQADGYLRQVAEATAGATMAQDLIVYFADGDSISNQNTYVGASGGVGSHVHRVLKARPTQLSGTVIAAAGSAITGVIDDLQTWQLNAMEHLVDQGQNVIMTVLVGANDTPIISNPTTWYNDLITQVYRPARAIGVKVIAHTVLPKENVGAFVGHNTGRAVVNNLLRTHPEEWDALADFDTQPVGADGAPAARVLYTDGVHPNGLGYDDMEEVEIAALDSIIADL